ncbi:MAG: GreA/GreB family elongation factor [Planctomycetes bacterium]|nr:GreA/GreB family elongation factor [Planctomycetota bacterium]
MKDLLKLARKGKLDEVEDIWMSALQDDLDSWEFLLKGADVLVNHGDGAELAETLLWYLITALREENRLEAALTSARKGCSLLPNSEMMREEAVDLYRAINGRTERADALMKWTLDRSDLPLDEAEDRLEILEELCPGAYVRVDPGAKLGRVEKIDPDDGVIVEFENRTRNFKPDDLEKLQTLPPDDIRALVMFEQKRVNELAEEDPERLVTLTLQTFGGRTPLKRIRRYLRPALGKSNWSSWWSKTKKTLEQSPNIGMTASSNPDLFLRSEPVSRGDQLKRKFDRKESAQKLSLVYQILAENLKGDEADELISHIGGELAGLAANGNQSDQIRLGAIALRDRLSKEYPGAEVPRQPDTRQLVDELDLGDALKDPRGKKRIRNEIIQALPEWMPENWTQLLAEVCPFMPQAAFGTAIEKLRAAESAELLEDVFKRALQRPDAHPGAVLWLWHSFVRYGDENLPENMDAMAILRRLLSVTSSLGRPGSHPETERKQLLSKIRDLVTGEGEKAVEQALENSTDEVILALSGQVDRNQGLGDTARPRVARAIRATRPRLFRTATPPWKEKVIYTTEEGMEKRREEYRKIVDERMPEVIKQIGEAADFGDLSENAEYTAALEERSRLSEEAAAIQDELSRTRIIPPEMPDTEHVTVGSHIRVRDEHTGEERTMSFLGPWDADPRENIYSYQAPLSQKFMGHQVGDVVKSPGADGEKAWEIIEIGSGL